jgi:hypothetical protein
VQQSGAFEIHFGAEAFARSGGGIQQGMTIGAQERGDPLRFRLVFGVADGELAGAKAATHFTVDTATMICGWLKIFFAAAELKQIQDFVLKAAG